MNAAGVNAIVCSGMGFRAVNRFNELGIKVYFADNEHSVEGIVRKLKNNELKEFLIENDMPGTSLRCIMIQITRIRARYEESDQMGFIHHSNYVVWMELARMNLLRECGINYRELETKGFILPVTKIVAKYISPAYFDDEIQIHAAFTSISKVKIRVDYLVFRNEKELLCYGYTEHCFLTKEAKKAIRIPEPIYEKLKLSKTAINWRTNNLA